MLRTCFLWHLKNYLRLWPEVFSFLAIYLLLTSLFVFSQPAGTALGSFAIGILFVFTLLALALALHSLYEKDMEEGWLEQWPFLPITLESVVGIKVLVHWLMVGLPLAILTPLICILLGKADFSPSLMICLLLTTLAFTALGSMAAAASLRHNNTQMLSMILIFPLSIPLVIFGAPASNLPLDAFFFSVEGLAMLAYTGFILPVGILASVKLLKYAAA